MRRWGSRRRRVGNIGSYRLPPSVVSTVPYAGMHLLAPSGTEESLAAAPQWSHAPQIERRNDPDGDLSSYPSCQPEGTNLIEFTLALQGRRGSDLGLCNLKKKCTFHPQECEEMQLALSFD